MSRHLLNGRNLSLIAVSLQSTVLAVVLHLSQEHTQFRASSAVLLTELIKFFLSSLLALYEIKLEQNHFKKPVHKLPSPLLWAKADELQSKSIYAEDPYDLPPEFGIRRRSSAFGLDLGIEFEGEKHKPQQSLSKFSFPASPLLDEVFERAGVVKVQNLPVYPRLLPTLWNDITGSGWWKMAGPAFLFAIQNNLIYIAARNLSVPVFQITFQLKTLFTAVAAVVILQRSLSYTQWISLLVLSAGVASIQIGAIHEKSIDSHSHAPLDMADNSSYVTGLVSVLISVVCSSIAATYFEYVIKTRVDGAGFEYLGPRNGKPASLWVRNIQLSAFSLLVGIVVALVESQVGFDGKKGELSFFSGFEGIVWLVIVLQSVGGLLIGFAVSISIVFTFLLSILLFDFKISTTSFLGGAGVIFSAFLYEVDEQRLLSLFGRRNSMEIQSRPRKKSIKWYLLILPLFCISIVVPVRYYSLTTVVWEVFTKSVEKGDGLPTLAIADMSSLNSLLEISAVEDCGWAVRSNRQSTQSAYGELESSKKFTPYSIRDTDQYALDDILYTRIKLLALPLFSIPSPDFILLPLLSQIYSSPWDCPSPARLTHSITQITHFIRQFAASIGSTDFPRIILPISGIRSNLEKELFTPEIMEELRGKVIIVGIEGALKSYGEGLDFVIDVPYPTRNHFDLSNVKGETIIDAAHYYFHRKRPYLLHYAGAKSHSWNSVSDSFNGFELRAAIHDQLSSHLKSANAVSRILYDEIPESHNGALNSSVFSEHMAMSKFCLAPPGDSPTRRSFYEALQVGCIPVIFREKSYNRLFPSSSEFLPSDFSIYIDENEIVSGSDFESSLIARLESVSAKKISDLQYNIRKISEGTVWAIPNEDLFFPLTGNSMREVPIVGETFKKEDWRFMNRGRVERKDAFSFLMKELKAIKEGKWEPRETRDTRAGIQAKQYGTWRSEIGNS